MQQHNENTKIPHCRNKSKSNRNIIETEAKSINLKHINKFVHFVVLALVQSF